MHLLRQRVCFALNKERPCRDKQEGDKIKIMPSVESQKQKGKEKYGTARTSVFARVISGTKQALKMSYFAVFLCCVSVVVMFIRFPSLTESEAQWRSVQVARL